MAQAAVNLSDSPRKPPVSIGDRLQLFVDDHLLYARASAVLRLHPPIPREVAISFDAPWEGPSSTYVAVAKEGARYHAWYRGSGPGHEVTCYAHSTDGIVWQKPALGLFAFNGSKENNIIWTGKGAHNFTPFLDTNPAAKPEERFKALAGGPLLALASPDGVHWKPMREEPVITQGAFDSQNLAFWDSARGRYAAYYRGFRNGVRAVLTSTSDDFLHWTPPQWIELGDTPAEHFYTNATTPYFRAPYLLLAFPMRFVPDRKWNPSHPELGISDGVFLTSRDGVRFDRTFMEAFLRKGRMRDLVAGMPVHVITNPKTALLGAA
ncbi:MAG: glucokinase, partial [Armatimonadota bacterium]|nr:glucokinase [Armatimonadota bacterium]